MAEKEGTNRFERAGLAGLRFGLKATPLLFEAMAAAVMLRKVVDDNPSFAEKLGALDGKLFWFEATDIDKGFFLRIAGKSIKVELHDTAEPDVTMKGNVGVLVDLFLGRVDPDTVFFSRRLEITGDTSVAIHFKNILAALD